MCFRKQRYFIANARKLHAAFQITADITTTYSNRRPKKNNTKKFYFAIFI